MRKGGGATGSIEAMSSLAKGVERFCAGPSNRKEDVCEIWEDAKEIVEESEFEVLDFGDRNSGILAVDLDGLQIDEEEKEKVGGSEMNGAIILDANSDREFLEEGIPSLYPRVWLHPEPNVHLENWEKDHRQMKECPEKNSRKEVLRFSLHHHFHTDNGSLHSGTEKAIREALNYLTHISSS
jgi:hypothetical protein